MRKEFLQNYKIKLALVTNPKTPAAISLKLLNYVMEKDLRSIWQKTEMSTRLFPARPYACFPNREKYKEQGKQ